MFISPLIDLGLCHLPVFGKFMVVLQNCFLDGVHHYLELLTICFILLVNPSDLGSVGFLLPLCIIHLKERISRQSKHPTSIPYPVFQLQDMGKGAKLHGCRVLDGLCCLVHTIIRTSPVEDPHMEQAEQDWNINPRPINLIKPFHPLDHIHPELIVKEEVQVHVPPPLVMDNLLIIGLILFNYPMIGVLGDLQSLPVIVMTFWYVFWNGLNFFELFKLYFHLGLITTPHVL